MEVDQNLAITIMRMKAQMAWGRLQVGDAAEAIELARNVAILADFSQALGLIDETAVDDFVPAWYRVRRTSSASNITSPEIGL
jgi:hypothetical protein